MNQEAFVARLCSGLLKDASRMTGATISLPTSVSNIAGVETTSTSYSASLANSFRLTAVLERLAMHVRSGHRILDGQRSTEEFHNLCLSLARFCFLNSLFHSFNALIGCWEYLSGGFKSNVLVDDAKGIPLRKPNVAVWISRFRFNFFFLFFSLVLSVTQGNVNPYRVYLYFIFHFTSPFLISRVLVWSLVLIYRSALVILNEFNDEFRCGFLFMLIFGSWKSLM